MKIIKTYDSFVNESFSTDDKDINSILSYIYFNIDSKDIPEIKKELKAFKFESVNESIFTELKNKLVKWFDDKMMLYFINKKKTFYTELIGKLDMFDLTTLEDVVKAYPKFRTCDALYLAGGMDKSKDTGAGWRNVIEYVFEMKNPGNKKNNEEIVLKYENKNISVHPSYVVDGDNLNKLITQGKSFLKKFYNKPGLLNPVRKEVDRTKNAEFADAVDKFKSGINSTSKDPKDFAVISDILSKSIEPDDEKLLLIADALLYGANESDSSGTFGELQTLSFLNKPLFVWYQKDWKMEGHSMWTVPHITKILRSQEDLEIFAKTILKFNK